MAADPRSTSISRRGLLRAAALFAGAATIPVLAACASQATPTPAPAPTAPPAPTQPPKVVTQIVTQVVQQQVPVTQVVQQTVQVVVTPTPQTNLKIVGNLQIIQERGFNPLQTDYIHNLLIKTAAQLGWPLDLTYSDAFVGGTDFFQKIAATVASGNSPDLMFTSQDTFQSWNQGSLQAVDDTVNWAVQQFGQPAPLMKLSHNIGGKWYAVPYFTTTGGYWVRKSWFDKINFDVTVQHSLQEWLDACVEVSDPSKKMWGWGNTVNRGGDGQTNVYSPLWQSGARVTTADNKVAFNSDNTVATFDWIKDLYTNPKYAKALPTGVNTWTDPSNNQAYLAGTIGFSSNAGTMFATAMVQQPQIAADTHLIPHPSGPVGEKQSLIVAGPGTYHFWVMMGALNPDPAKYMIQTLMSQDNQQNVWKNSPGHSTPAYTWGWDSDVFKPVPNNVIGVSKDIILSDKVFKMFQPAEEPKLWINAFDSQVVVTDTAADVLKGTASKDAVATATANIQKIYDKFQGK
jgi:multiple sugar transport system substrate-binding protein